MHLHNLYHVREYLNVKTRTLLVTNLILSKIDFCNILLIGSSQAQLNPLRLIINRSIRFILNINYWHHITPYYKKLHFLPINKRIEFKTCLIAHKIFFRLAPDYINVDFNKHLPVQRMMLREGVGRDTYMFQMDNSDIGNKLLFSKIRQTWNHLPLKIRQIDSLPLFKSKLKTLLFSQF